MSARARRKAREGEGSLEGPFAEFASARGAFACAICWYRVDGSTYDDVFPYAADDIVWGAYAGVCSSESDRNENGSSGRTEFVWSIIRYPVGSAMAWSEYAFSNEDSNMSAGKILESWSWSAAWSGVPYEAPKSTNWASNGSIIVGDGEDAVVVGELESEGMLPEPVEPRLLLLAAMAGK